MKKFALKYSKTCFQNAETRFQNAKTALSRIFLARKGMDSAQKKACKGYSSARFYLVEFDIPAMSEPSAGGPFLFVIMTVRHCLRWSGSLTASVVAFMDPLQLIWAKRASSSAFRRIPDR